MRHLIEQLLTKITDMGAGSCEPHEVYAAADALEAAMQDEPPTLNQIVTGGHTLTATKESTGFLINIVKDEGAETPTFVAEVLVEVFDGAAGVYIYNELDEAPTQTIRL